MVHIEVHPWGWRMLSFSWWLGGVWIFLPPFFFSPLGKSVSPTKNNSCPPFSSYSNCVIYSFDCSLFVLNIFFIFFSISSHRILSYLVFISSLVLILLIVVFLFFFPIASLIIWFNLIFMSSLTLILLIYFFLGFFFEFIPSIFDLFRIEFC